jgi:hypothetical protein
VDQESKVGARPATFYCAKVARCFVSRDREVELANLDTLAQLRKLFLQCGGEANPVDDDYYAEFVNLTDHELDTILALLMQDWADAFNEICEPGFDEPGPNSLFTGLIEALLYMVARGFILFDRSGRARYLPPDGPPPSEAVERGIAARIREVQQFDRLMAIVDEVVRGN